MTSNYKIGKADIRKLVLRSARTNQEVNISLVANEIFVYEDLYSSYITSNINIADGTSLLTTLPIVGGEELSMIITDTSDNSRKLDRNLIAFKLSNRIRIKPDFETYTLNLTTKENLLDAGTSVDRSYKKPIHQIIQDVVTEYLTPVSGKRLVSYEETKGIQHIVATGITVNAFIKQLCREAESLTNPSSIYMFYETMEGYHFETLDGLYSKEPSHKFIHDELQYSEANPGASKILEKNISFLEINNSFNLLHGQIGGQYNIEVDSFDPLTKTFRSGRYNYSEDKFNKNNNKTLPKRILDGYLDKPTVNKYIITNSHRSGYDYVVNSDSENQNTFRRRQDFLAKESSTLMQFGSMRIHFSVPANPNVIVGQTMDIIIPRADDTERGKRINDPFISGKYIATAIAHKIDAVTGEYATVIEAMRKNYPEQVT